MKNNESMKEEQAFLRDVQAAFKTGRTVLIIVRPRFRALVRDMVRGLDPNRNTWGFVRFAFTDSEITGHRFERVVYHPPSGYPSSYAMRYIDQVLQKARYNMKKSESMKPEILKGQGF
jgi:hypothetical protein